MTLRSIKQFGMNNANRIYCIKKSLEYLIRNNIIPKPKGRYIDLGTAEGVGVCVLREEYGVDAIGVEEHEDELIWGKKKGLLFEEQAVHGDFFSYLSSMTEKVDGITAFLIDYPFIQETYELATRNLNHRGIILFTSNAPFPVFWGPKYYELPFDILDKYCLIKTCDLI